MSQKSHKFEYKGIITENRRTYYVVDILYLNDSLLKEQSEQEKKLYIEKKNSQEPQQYVKIQANISGKMRSNRVRIVVGDYVTVLISPQDVTKGMIKFRDKTDL